MLPASRQLARRAMAACLKAARAEGSGLPLLFALNPLGEAVRVERGDDSSCRRRGKLAVGRLNVISNRGRKLGDETTVSIARGPTRGPNPKLCTTSILGQYGNE